MKVNKIDKSSPEWKRVCLARYVCRQPSRLERKRLTEHFSRKDPAFKEEVLAQWNTRGNWDKA